MTRRSTDRFLDGRVVASQPVDGFRSGLDAVMVAAAIPALEGDEVFELGSGAGTASLCLAARVPACRVFGIDVVQDLVELARENARTNHMESRVHFVQGNALDLPVDYRRSFDHVFCNPPYHGREGNPSPNTKRALALQDENRLGDWLAAGLRRVVSGGTLSAIIRADRLGEALHALPPRGIAILPLWPRAGEAAKRVIVNTTMNSRAPLALLAGLVLHEEDGRYTEQAEAVLRHAGSLAVGSPRL